MKQSLLFKFSYIFFPFIFAIVYYICALLPLQRKQSNSSFSQDLQLQTFSFTNIIKKLAPINFFVKVADALRSLMNMAFTRYKNLT